MTVPFGFSVGDFVAGIGLVRDVIEALQASSSSTARYQGLMSELFALERALLEVKKLGLGDNQATQPERLEIEALHGVLRLIVTQCQDTINKLLEKIKKYEGHLSANGSGSKLKDALRKVQWALLTDKDLEESRAEIRGHSNSITMLLTLTQLKTMRLQSQEGRNDQMKFVRWFQQGYIEITTNLTRALAGIGRNLQQLLETADVHVRLDYQMFQKVLEIHQYVSPSLRYTEYGEPITFVDAFGKETRFYLDFVYSAAILEDWLKRRFEEAGYEKILNREYALEDMKTKRQINFSRDWQTQLYPGMCLGMDMIYERHQDQVNTCPGCQREYLGATDEDAECPNCGVHFRRIDELPELEGDSDNFSNTRKATTKPLDLLQSHQKNERNESISDSCTPEKRVQLWMKRRHQEQEQIRLFRRFRFQATRIESDLAMLNVGCVVTIVVSVEEYSKPVVERKVAEEIYIQMLKKLEGNHNPRPPNIIRGLNSLGCILLVYKKLEEAENVFLRILEDIGGSLRPQDARAVCRALNNLALVKYWQGKQQEAEMLFRQGLNGLERGLDYRNLISIDLCNNLAITLRSQNKVREAQDLQERVIEKVGDRYGRYGNRELDISFYRNNLEWIQR